MATLPSYARVLLSEFGDKIDPSVLRTEMERGPAKQVLKNSQTRRELQATLFFASQQDANSFVDWYFLTIKRIGWFDWLYPRTGKIIQVRFKDGDIGTLIPHVGKFYKSQRAVTMEYYE